MENTKPVFVFGSNLAGRHGKGAALIAKLYYGAQYGIGLGPVGNSYAIPTKDTNLKTLNVNTIKGYVDRFITYANKNPNKLFHVTAIGTGLAGHSHDDIAPLFYFAPLNCILPVRWKSYFPNPEERQWWNS